MGEANYIPLLHAALKLRYGDEVFTQMNNNKYGLINGFYDYCYETASKDIEIIVGRDVEDQETLDNIDNKWAYQIRGKKNYEIQKEKLIETLRGIFECLADYKEPPIQGHEVYSCKDVTIPLTFIRKAKSKTLAFNLFKRPDKHLSVRSLEKHRFKRVDNRVVVDGEEYTKILVNFSALADLKNGKITKTTAQRASSMKVISLDVIGELFQVYGPIGNCIDGWHTKADVGSKSLEELQKRGHAVPSETSIKNYVNEYLADNPTYVIPVSS